MFIKNYYPSEIQIANFRNLSGCLFLMSAFVSVMHFSHVSLSEWNFLEHVFIAYMIAITIAPLFFSYEHFRNWNNKIREYESLPEDSFVHLERKYTLLQEMKELTKAASGSELTIFFTNTWEKNIEKEERRLVEKKEKIQKTELEEIYNLILKIKFEQWWEEEPWEITKKFSNDQNYYVEFSFLGLFEGAFYFLWLLWALIWFIAVFREKFLLVLFIIILWMIFRFALNPKKQKFSKNYEWLLEEFDIFATHIDNFFKIFQNSTSYYPEFSLIYADFLQILTENIQDRESKLRYFQQKIRRIKKNKKYLKEELQAIVNEWLDLLEQDIQYVQEIIAYWSQAESENLKNISENTKNLPFMELSHSRRNILIKNFENISKNQ